MGIEIIIALIVIVALGAIWYSNRKTGFDANQDGVVDLKDAGVMLEKTVEEVKAVADVNNDGKVDVADVAVVKEKAKVATKKAATKAKETVKKATTRGRKPKAK